MKSVMHRNDKIVVKSKKDLIAIFFGVSKITEGYQRRILIYP